MARVDVLDIANAEFATARKWYRTQSAVAAKRFAIEVKNAIDAIRRNPERFSRIDETYRHYLVDNFPYYVAYRQSTHGITIVAIRHSSQDQGAWKGR